MPRKPRIEKTGFYHVINRGVAKENVYLCDDDFFLSVPIILSIKGLIGGFLYL